MTKNVSPCGICGKKHAGLIINKKEENGRRKNLIFAITGGIFHNGLVGFYQGDKSRNILKWIRNSSGLLIRKH